ncbi:Rpn family recombination-promoting nuclease/putative transposase [Virgibacillus siamensis]|uniref:Rpn family recombination-promoting nuclease/putative transposase n=1 Tax=Virgibacillus siamensis TaxID=480071 RepID=UPI00098563F1|nr:Rpn family recombination-promoting nuclease/putative transposase [Virgibacillus siamensis]
MSVFSLVREGKKDYVHHDQLFKELIHHFFEEFLEAFFPEVSEYVDFQSIKPLSEEVFTDMHEGDARRLDIVVETRLKNQDAVIIVHIEPQSSTQSDFHERMYLYFSLLYNKYRKPIIPIAVYTYDESLEQREFNMSFPFHRVLTFNFFTLHLRKKNWRDYIRSNNPVAAALLSKMGYSESERIQVKKEFLRMLAKMKLDPARQRWIYGFFERYLKLDEREEGELMKEIRQMGDAEMLSELPISYEEKGIAKGMEKGMEKGKQLGKLEEAKRVAKEMLKEDAPIDFISRVTHLEPEDIEKLK